LKENNTDKKSDFGKRVNFVSASLEFDIRNSSQGRFTKTVKINGLTIGALPEAGKEWAHCFLPLPSESTSQISLLNELEIAIPETALINGILRDKKDFAVKNLRLVCKDINGKEIVSKMIRQELSFGENVFSGGLVIKINPVYAKLNFKGE